MIFKMTFQTVFVPIRPPTWTHLGATSAQVVVNMASKWRAYMRPDPKSSNRPFQLVFSTFCRYSFEAMSPMLCFAWTQLGVNPQKVTICIALDIVHRMASICGNWTLCASLGSLGSSWAPSRAASADSMRQAENLLCYRNFKRFMLWCMGVRARPCCPYLGFPTQDQVAHAAC